MNRFLIVYVFILLLFAVVWESITIWFYSQPSSAIANTWYIHGVYDYFGSLTARQQVSLHTCIPFAWWQIIITWSLSLTSRVRVNAHFGIAP